MSIGISWNRLENKLEQPAYWQLNPALFRQESGRRRSNSATPLRYFCAITPIGWNRRSNKPGWPAYFQLIRLGNRGAFPSGYFIARPNKAASFRLIQPKGVKFA